MKNFLMMSCALIAFGAPAHAAAEAEKAAPSVSYSTAGINPETMQKIAACKALGEEKAYDDNKMDSYTMLVPGKGGWLLRSGTDMKSEFGFHKKRVAQLLQLQAALAKKGTTLYIAYLPNRGIIAEDKIPLDHPLAKGYDTAAARASYDKMITDLKAQGLNIFAFQEKVAAEDFFRKADQHWNSNGTKLFAKAFAEAVKKEPVYKELTKTEFVTEAKGTYEYEGRFGVAVKKMCGIDIDKDVDVEYITAPKAGGATEGDLFGDAKPAEVVLVGTSNSKADTFNTNFDGFLKEYLSADVSNMAFPGAGVNDPMMAYLNSESFKKNPPKLLIWEIPGYYQLTSEGGRFMDEIVPASIGDCFLAKTSFEDVKIEGERLTLAADLGPKGMTDGEYYLRLEFSKPVTKAFTVFFKYKEKLEQKYRFKRDKRYPEDAVYYAHVPAREEEDGTKLPLSSLEIKPDKSMDGMTVTGRFCAYPGDIIKAGKAIKK